MKPTLRKNMLLALFVAAFGAGTAFAGDPPVSPTSGVIQVSLPTSKSTLLAVPFAKSIPIGGKITSVSGTTLGVDQTLTPGALTNHSIYIATQVDPAAAGAYGRMVRITGNTATEITTEAAITPVVGDGFDIIEQHTLSSLFGVLGSYSLQSGATVGTSDIIYVENAGVFTGYWHKTGTGFRLQSDTAGTGADQASVGINFGRGLIVTRKALGGVKTINIAGESLTGRFRPLTTANASSLINNPFAVATTLSASGIDSFITKGATTSTSDTVYIEDAGIITGYWFKTGSGWRLLSDTAGTGADQGSVPLVPGKAILFRDRLAAGFAMHQPFNP